MLPSRFCWKRIVFFFFHASFSLFFQVFDQFLKGFVYPLAAKSTQVQDLAHQKERVALWCSWIQFPPFTGALSFSLSLCLSLSLYIYITVPAGLRSHAGMLRLVSFYIDELSLSTSFYAALRACFCLRPFQL